MDFPLYFNIVISKRPKVFKDWGGQGRTNERPGIDHVISGPIRGPVEPIQ